MSDPPSPQKTPIQSLHRADDTFQESASLPPEGMFLEETLSAGYFMGSNCSVFSFLSVSRLCLLDTLRMPLEAANDALGAALTDLRASNLLRVHVRFHA